MKQAHGFLEFRSVTPERLSAMARAHERLYKESAEERRDHPEDSEALRVTADGTTGNFRVRTATLPVWALSRILDEAVG